MASCKGMIHMELRVLITSVALPSSKFIQDYLQHDGMPQLGSRASARTAGK